MPHRRLDQPKCQPKWKMRAKEEPMCPACLATLAMIIAGATSTGGVATVLVNKFRVKKGVKKMVEVGRSEWTQTKEKES